MRATVRREVRIERTPDDVWAIVGDPARLHEWFPGVVDCRVDGDTRVITLGSGLPMAEQILAVDPIQRRFQYRVTGGVFTEHLGPIDVIDLADGTSLVVYSTDAAPAAMALVLAGAAGNALGTLRRTLEGAS